MKPLALFFALALLSIAEEHRLIIGRNEYAILRTNVSNPPAASRDRSRQRIPGYASRSEIYTVWKLHGEKRVVVVENKRCNDQECGTDEQIVRREIKDVVCIRCHDREPKTAKRCGSCHKDAV